MSFSKSHKKTKIILCMHQLHGSVSMFHVSRSFSVDVRHTGPPADTLSSQPFLVLYASFRSYMNPLSSEKLSF